MQAVAVVGMATKAAHCRLAVMAVAATVQQAPFPQRLAQQTLEAVAVAAVAQAQRVALE
jgi:hypothetical protein